MSKRAWNLRLNLDDFNSGYARQDTDKELADFLRGFFKGVNGASLRGDASDSMASGFGLGEEMRLEADNYMAQSVENGKKGVAAKSNKNEAPFQGGCEGNSTQSTIHNPQSTELITTIPEGTDSPNPPVVVRAKREPDPREQEMIVLWNTMASENGYPKISSLGPKRLVALRARLKEPGWWECVPNALAFLAGSDWHHQYPHHANIDVFLRPEKANGYAEKVGLIAKPKTNSPAGRAEIDAIFIDQLEGFQPTPTGGSSDLEF